MEQYIPKSALIGEIKDRICSYQEYIDSGYNYEDRKQELEDLLLSINTLEVKEVDLENELKEDWLFADKTEVDCLECMCLTEDEFVSLAKKYFKLGLKTMKGE